MMSLLSRLTTFDWAKNVAYAIAGLTVFLGPGVLQAWGVSASDAPVWSTRIASVIAVLTLISNSLKNPSPPSGMTSALIGKGEVPVTADKGDAVGLATAKALPGTVAEPTAITPKGAP